MPTKEKIGRNFLVSALLSWLLAINAFAQDGQIMLPPPPQVKPPPRRSEERVQKDFEERKEVLDKKIEATKPPEKTPEEVENRKLVAEYLTPRPYRFMASVHLHLTFPKVKEPREEYAMDPSGGFQIQYRPGKAPNSDSLQVWTGFRSIFFNGTGYYKKQPTRFSFAYFGPTIGLGKISLPAKSLAKDSMASSDSMAEAMSPQSGWFAFTGIAAQSRFGSTPAGVPKAEEENDTKRIAFDAPGVWTELSYLRVYYGALSVHYLAGAQLGRGKIFAYIGIGTGGLY